MKKTLLALALCLPIATLAQATVAKPPAATPAPGRQRPGSAAPAPRRPKQARAAAAKALEKQAMAERADIVAKNMGLTTEQAAKFWPLYQKYQDGFSELFTQQLDIIAQVRQPPTRRSTTPAPWRS